MFGPVMKEQNAVEGRILLLAQGIQVQLVVCSSLSMLVPHIKMV
jgi:hypothetical protein